MKVVLNSDHLKFFLFLIIGIFQFQMAITDILLYLASGYAVTSALLFLFPHLLHKKILPSHKLFTQSLTQNRILKISHRGSPRYGTENTIQSFRKVFHISDCLQMDICQTADKVLVVHHDKSLQRSCGVDKLISQLKFDELPRYQDQLKLDFAVDMSMTTNNEKIPKLQTVFQIFQGVPLDIELKTPTESAIKQFIRLIHKYEREEYTIIGIRGKQNSKLSEQYIQKYQQKQTNKKILTFMNDKAVLKLYLSYFLGLLPFRTIKQASMQIPIYSKQFEGWALARARENDQSELKIKIGCQMLRLINFMSKPLIWHLKQRGVMTFGWVCNTKQAMERAAWMGVQGIMSDQPYQLQQFIKQDNKNKKIE